jgi:hypothetical protein
VTGFFERMGERASGRETPLRLRPAQPFEELLGQALSLDGEPVEGVEVETAPGPVEPSEGASATTLTKPSVAPRRGHEDRRDVPDALLREADAARDGARRDRPAPDVAPERSSAREMEAAARARQRAISPPDPSRRARAGAPALDLHTLLREHVVPALVDRGVVKRDEEPVDAPAQGPTIPPPGKFAVEARHVAGLPPPLDAETAGPSAPDRPPEVHVHIDRVMVTRAPPPPPEPPRSTVDHDAYLARRRERR